jgi:ribosomal protein S18 acetylase RimI-like enzyme
MFHIRDMRVSDIDDASAIVTAHNATDGRLAIEYYRDYFANMQRALSERERSFVGIYNDSIMGIVGFSPDKYGSADILWLSWFYVHPDFRHKGYGRMLLRYVLNVARTLRMRKIYLDTSSDVSYAPSVALYEQFGFCEEGRLLDYYGFGEHYLIMGLVL